jgi:hypothetical protein
MHGIRCSHTEFEVAWNHLRRDASRLWIYETGAQRGQSSFGRDLWCGIICETEAVAQLATLRKRMHS